LESLLEQDMVEIISESVASDSSDSLIEDFFLLYNEELHYELAAVLYRRYINFYKYTSTFFGELLLKSQDAAIIKLVDEATNLYNDLTNLLKISTE
jgi:hypothetical protein